MLLLDTDVVSELRKVRAGKADIRVAAWAQRLDYRRVFLSAIVIHELELGTLLVERRDAVQGRRLRDWLNDQVLATFAGRILPVDTSVVQRSAALHVPDPRPIRDGLIAATALVHGLAVATRNVADFAPLGVHLINPWTAAAT